MVHALLEASDTHSVTEFRIEPDTIFVRNGALGEAGLIENIAQTAATQIGYLCHLRGKPVPVGYIAAIKRLGIYSLPEVHSTLRTTITLTNKIMDVTVAEGKVEQDGKVLCSCEMRIFAKMD